MLAGIFLYFADMSQWVAIASAGLMFSVLSGWNSVLNGIQNAARQRVVVAFHQGVEPWARFLLAAMMIQGLGRNSFAAMSGYCVATAGLVYLISQKLGLGANPGLGTHVGW